MDGKHMQPMYIYARLSSNGSRSPQVDMLEMIPDRPDEGLVPVRAAVRQVLDAIGQRLAASRAGEAGELERLAAFLRIAEDAGLRQHEIAERAGVSRQTLTNLRNSSRGEEHAMPLDTRLMMGLAEPRKHDDLVSTYARGPVSSYEVDEALERLLSAGAIRVAGLIPKGDSNVAIYRLTASGTAALPGRLHDGAMPPSMAWTAYVSCSHADADMIAGRGEEALGEHKVVVIPAGTVHGMELPEVAFYVEAPANDFQAAVVAAATRYRQLRRHARLPDVPEPILVRALVPPNAGYSSPGVGASA